MFESLFHSLGQSRPDSDCKDNTFKDASEVLLLQNLHKYSLVVVESLFHAFGQSGFENGLKILLSSIQWGIKL